MKTYEAYVRTPNGIVVRSHVQADNSLDALNLLRGMFGESNIVHLPSEL